MSHVFSRWGPSRPDFILQQFAATSVAAVNTAFHQGIEADSFGQASPSLDRMS